MSWTSSNGIIYDGNGDTIAEIEAGTDLLSREYAILQAGNIVAAVNACTDAGLPVEALEAGAVAKLVGATKEAWGILNRVPITEESEEDIQSAWKLLGDALAPFDKETT